MGHHGTLRGKALNMLGFLFKEGHRDEKREIGVDMARILEGLVKVLLDKLPEGVAVRSDDHAAPYRGIVGQFGCLDHVEVPLGIVLLP